MSEDFEFTIPELDGEEPQVAARRIAACVGACAGISTEALEAGVIAELIRIVGIIIGNAVIGPDATMNGSTDCYHVPIDDIETVKTVLAKLEAE